MLEGLGEKVNHSFAPLVAIRFGGLFALFVVVLSKQDDKPFCGQW